MSLWDMFFWCAKSKASTMSRASVTSFLSNASVGLPLDAKNPPATKGFANGDISRNSRRREKELIFTVSNPYFTSLGRWIQPLSFEFKSFRACTSLCKGILLPKREILTTFLVSLRPKTYENVPEPRSAPSVPLPSLPSRHSEPKRSSDFSESTWYKTLKPKGISSS